MIKRLLILSLMWGGVAHAQVAIGVELPHESAELQIQAKTNDRGVLISEVALKGIEDKTVIRGGNPKEGLIVYNTTEDATVNLSKGFYYWSKLRIDGNNQPVMGWNKIVDSSGVGEVLQTAITLESKPPVDGDGKGQGFDIKSNSNVVGSYSESLTDFKVVKQLYDILVKVDELVVGPTNVYITVPDPNVAIDPSKILQGYDWYNREEVNELQYQDELGVVKKYIIKDFISDSETITTLYLDYDYPINDTEKGPALIYTNEIGEHNVVLLSTLLQNSEVLTKLTVDLTTNMLIYHDEESNSNPVDVNAIVKSPWVKSLKTSEKPLNGDDIYTDGWVGIGVDKPSGNAINEKLNVNGSITAVNSYYADYVFDAYFEGTSSLKYDYNFNDLNKVEEFIKVNRHLPGITSIKELTKTSNGYAFNMSELSVQLLEKTEELYLHVIEQKKEIDLLREENVKMKDQLKEIERMLNQTLSK